MSGAARSSRRFGRRLLRLRRDDTDRSGQKSRNDHHPAEPADADLAAVPAERLDPLWFVTRLERTLPVPDTLGQLLRLVSELVSFSFLHAAVRTLAPDPCSSAGPGLSFRTHFRVEFVTELFQRVQILLFSQDLLAFQVNRHRLQ